ncbi:cysteine--tRNA ligase [Scrofimicrobium sp. R131]|uniref:Cysteine--tRNA ligase n=1 Tax=Scrofimicrobium appendicitidis TaxID=3079930 RepID=A0AAU7V867_9ACTO
MKLRLYDTKSRTVQVLEPVHPGRVGIYLCGPTVQGSPHIGHLRAAVAFDVLIRWLGRLGLSVTYIRNITDIDDKILTKAREAGEPWWQLAARYEREFEAAYRQLGLISPTFEPRATGHITDQVQLIQRLLDRGHAYADAAGNVFFDVHSQPDYGSLTNQQLGDLLTTEDPAQEDEANRGAKRDPRDFALWKAAKPEEPETASWPAPWGRGRPGWHLECSAMSHRYLGETFDIHGGGLDLRFPHHENEQAQSHAAGWEFARLWLHNAWVTQAGDKMSKSLGNTLALDALLEQYPASVIRLALGTVHYRSMIEWGDETLARAEGTWDRLAGFVADATARVGDPGPVDLPADRLPTGFVEAMNDDLNVAGALAVIYEHLKLGRRALSAGQDEAVRTELQLVRSMLDVLGIDPGSSHWARPDGTDPAGEAQYRALDSLVSTLVEQRNRARSEKDWAAADRIRDQLTEAGIVVEDGADGSVWKVRV